MEKGRRVDHGEEVSSIEEFTAEKSPPQKYGMGGRIHMQQPGCWRTGFGEQRRFGLFFCPFPLSSLFSFSWYS